MHNHRTPLAKQKPKDGPYGFRQALVIWLYTLKKKKKSTFHGVFLFLEPGPMGLAYTVGYITALVTSLIY